MKKITVFLADTTYSALVGNAALEAIDLPQFCSAVLTEFADSKKQAVINNGVANESLPDTISQVLAVAKYVWVDGLEFNEAVDRTAKDLSVQSTTVRDKCTRRISLTHMTVDTSKFRALLSQPTALQDHLCLKYPDFKEEIAIRFYSLVSCIQSFPNGAAVVKPTAEAGENQLLQAIVNTLRDHGGTAPKSVVEGAVFQKFKAVFDTPHFLELVGPQVGFAGVPRWRKNIEFARNTARQMGLVKPPEESGRGIWALTETGKKWGAQ